MARKEITNIIRKHIQRYKGQDTRIRSMMSQQ